MDQQLNEINFAPYIRNDQYNFIRNQLKTILHAIATVKDQKVIDAVKLRALDQSIALFDELHEDQATALSEIINSSDEVEALNFLGTLENMLVPFPVVTKHEMSKLFPKLKKLKAPDLESIDFRKLSYMGWYDIRLNRKILIAHHENKLVGVQGTFRGSIKGMCTICNMHEEVGLFMSIVKSNNENYTSRGNYICTDSQKCNENITSIQRLNAFIDVVKKI